MAERALTKLLDEHGALLEVGDCELYVFRRGTEEILVELRSGDEGVLN